MNKLIIGLLVAFLITLGIFFYLKKKKDDDKKKSQTGGGYVPDTVQPYPTETNNNYIQPQVAIPIASASPNAPSVFPLVKGSRGIQVKMVQAALGLTVDGIFGAKTEAAVKANKVDLSTEQAFANRFLSVDETQYKNFPLKKGSKNNYVKAIQIFLSLTVDGIFGAKTEAAVKKATGKTSVWHADYTALYSKATGSKISYNSTDSDRSAFDSALLLGKI